MWRWILYRLALFAFIIWGSILTIRFVIERNKINREQPSESKSVSDKKEESPPESITFKDITFPKNFFFGTASSDFQTAGLSPASDWANEWEKMTDILKKDSRAKRGLAREPLYPGNANDLFNRYREDFDIAGQNQITQVHRISLEWARIEPEEGKWDLDAVKKYKEIFIYMKAKGIEPMICLNHFPNPQWFADKGGWENNQAPYYYERYAEFLAKELGAPLQI